MTKSGVPLPICEAVIHGDPSGDPRRPVDDADQVDRLAALLDRPRT